MISQLRNLLQLKKLKPKHTPSWFQNLISSEWLIIGVAGIIVIAVSSRVLLSSELFHVHDYVHGARIAEMRRGIEQGQFPVRWSENFGYGYGMPLFQFYAPFPYFITSLWYILTNDFIFSIKLLWWIPNLLTFIGGYVLGKKLFGWKSGLIVAVALTLAPYRAVNLYLRGAISESWAIMAFPWILWSVLGVFERSKKHWFGLIGWLGVLFLSHNLMTMLFFPVVLAWGFIAWLQITFLSELQSRNFLVRLIQGLRFQQSTKKIRNVQPLYYFLLAIVISVGLTSFYTLPALAEKQFTQIEERILGGYFHYSQHFLYIRQFLQENWKYGGSNWGPNDDMSYFLGYPQLILLCLAGFGLVGILATKLKQLQPSATFKLSDFKHLVWPTASFSFLVLSLYMSLEKSKWIWDSVEPLHVVQFPWRFLSIAVLFVALLNGWVISLVSSKIVQNLVVVLFISAVGILGWKYFSPLELLEDTSALYFSDPNRIQTEMSGILPDFIPYSVDRKIAPAAGDFVKPEQLNYQTLVDSAHFKKYRLKLTQEKVTEFSIAEFPGWRVKIDGQEIEPAVSALGLLEVLVPAGEHEVEAYLGRTTIRRNADLVSLLSFGLLCLFGGWIMYYRQRSATL